MKHSADDVHNDVDNDVIYAGEVSTVRRPKAAGYVSLVASLAKGVIKDRAAVRAGIISAWTNGQTEGQITKLKLVKLQMYGRAKIDLLEARLIGAA
jgi:transposase